MIAAQFSMSNLSNLNATASRTRPLRLENLQLQWNFFRCQGTTRRITTALVFLNRLPRLQCHRVGQLVQLRFGGRSHSVILLSVGLNASFLPSTYLRDIKIATQKLAQKNMVMNARQTQMLFRLHSGSNSRPTGY
jgi:hypothetical protein